VIKMVETRTVTFDFPIEKTFTDRLATDVGSEKYCYLVKDKEGNDLYNPEHRHETEAVLIVHVIATNLDWVYFFVDICNQFKKAVECAV